MKQQARLSIEGRECLTIVLVFWLILLRALRHRFDLERWFILAFTAVVGGILWPVFLRLEKSPAVRARLRVVAKGLAIALIAVALMDVNNLFPFDVPTPSSPPPFEHTLSRLLLSGLLLLTLFLVLRHDGRTKQPSSPVVDERTRAIEAAAGHRMARFTGRVLALLMFAAIILQEAAVLTIEISMICLAVNAIYHL
ncbi:MAG: hypothetical protein IJC43_07800, partial [Clostridia bacterium]|nr:hypothetical protein [Clostridia bacterium]